MTRQYASSVYSQKSTTSAKSGRSFLSLATPIWPTASEATFTEATKQPPGVWQSLKSWTTLKKKKNDSDSIITTRSSSSSLSKLKYLFVAKKKSPPLEDSPRLSFNGTEDEEEEDVATIVSRTSGPVGILSNRGTDTAEAIQERKKRRAERREYILKLQRHNKSLQQHYHHFPSNKEDGTADLNDDQPTTVTTTTIRVGFAQEEDEEQKDEHWCYNPRIMFIEPSPVPRFRNVAPPPPPSPPYLNILIQHEQDNNKMIIKSPTTDEDEPTIFASKDSFIQSDLPIIEQPLYNDDDEEEMLFLLSQQQAEKPRLYFNSPLYRGQTLKFSLQNTIPDDHIILFKFMTSNTLQHQPERYFVQPSAGKMVSSSNQSDILLILNQVPTEFIKKDKIMIRWAVIQKNTEIEKWVNTLQDSTRRKWIDMLDEEWPNQVTIRLTRIKIRFL